jgi:hypothetical protein
LNWDNFVSSIEALLNSTCSTIRDMLDGAGMLSKDVLNSINLLVKGVLKSESLSTKDIIIISVISIIFSMVLVLILKLLFNILKWFATSIYKFLTGVIRGLKGEITIKEYIELARREKEGKYLTGQQTRQLDKVRNKYKSIPILTTREAEQLKESIDSITKNASYR